MAINFPRVYQPYTGDYNTYGERGGNLFFPQAAYQVGVDPNPPVDLAPAPVNFGSTNYTPRPRMVVPDSGGDSFVNTVLPYSYNQAQAELAEEVINSIRNPDVRTMSGYENDPFNYNNPGYVDERGQATGALSSLPADQNIMSQNLNSIAPGFLDDEELGTGAYPGPMNYNREELDVGPLADYSSLEAAKARGGENYNKEQNRVISKYGTAANFAQAYQSQIANIAAPTSQRTMSQNLAGIAPSAAPTSRSGALASVAPIDPYSAAQTVPLYSPRSYDNINPNVAVIRNHPEYLAKYSLPALMSAQDYYSITRPQLVEGLEAVPTAGATSSILESGTSPYQSYANRVDPNDQNVYRGPGIARDIDNYVAYDPQYDPTTSTLFDPNQPYGGYAYSGIAPNEINPIPKSMSFFSQQDLLDQKREIGAPAKAAINPNQLAAVMDYTRNYNLDKAPVAAPAPIQAEKSFLSKLGALPKDLYDSLMPSRPDINENIQGKIAGLVDSKTGAIDTLGNAADFGAVFGPVGAAIGGIASAGAAGKELSDTQAMLNEYGAQPLSLGQIGLAALPGPSLSGYANENLQDLYNDFSPYAGMYSDSMFMPDDNAAQYGFLDAVAKAQAPQTMGSWASGLFAPPAGLDQASAYDNLSSGWQGDPNAPDPYGPFAGGGRTTTSPDQVNATLNRAGVPNRNSPNGKWGTPGVDYPAEQSGDGVSFGDSGGFDDGTSGQGTEGGGYSDESGYGDETQDSDW